MNRHMRRFLIGLSLLGMALIINGCLLGPPENEADEGSVSADPSTKTDEESLTRSQHQREIGHSANDARPGKADNAADPSGPPASIPGGFDEREPENCKPVPGGEFEPTPTCTEENSDDGVGHGSPQPLDPTENDENSDESDEE